MAAGTAAACSGARTARRPYGYDRDLGQSARFHARNTMLNGGGLSHFSFCRLRSDVEATGCDGAEACACVAGTSCFACEVIGWGGCGTDPYDRMALFGFAGFSTSETGAAGNATAWDAVGAWAQECGGGIHREIVTLPPSDTNVVGLGFFVMPAHACGFHSETFADYGHVAGLVTPRIPSAGHRPETGDAATPFSFHANYYDPAGDPTAIDVVVDGACRAMSVELGAAGNRTYLHAGSFAPGCHEYYFLARDRAGARVTYPESGAYVFSVAGGPACEKT